jgi:hypothetical protein
MGRNLGKLGESVLRNWGAQAGLIVNSSADQDETGWDFIVEWPLDHATDGAVTLLLDQAPSPLQCLFQVKSTDTLRRRCSIKLTNWWRFIHSPLPTFFLVLEFDGRDTCQRGYLVHLGEEHIERVLRRVRELSVTHPEENLREHTIDLTWGEDDQITMLDGQGLVSAVGAYTADGLQEYLQRKRAFLTSVGYESATRKLKIKPRVPDTWSGTVDQMLVEFGLGLIPHLELEAGEIIDLRFGIPRVMPEPLSEGTRLQIVQQIPSGRGRIRLGVPDSDDHVELHADVFLPRGVIVPQKLLKARYSMPFVDVVFGLSATRKINFKLKLPRIPEPYHLADYQPAAEIILLFHRAVELKSGRIEVQMFFENTRIGSGKLLDIVTPPHPLVEWAARVKNAWVIARHFEIERDVVVSAADLVRHRRQLHLISSVLGSAPLWLEVGFTLNEAEVDSSLPWCFPMAATVQLGQYYVQVSFILVGNPQPTGEIENGSRWFSVRTDDVRRLKKSLVRDANALMSSDITLMEAIADELSEEFEVAVLSHLPWLTRGTASRNP